MIRIGEETLERWIREDVPYLDLTTTLLGIGAAAGSIRYRAREASVACGTEEVARIFSKLGIDVTHSVASGAELLPGDVLIEGRGPAQALHQAWKTCVNILEHGGGIATRTRRILDAARAEAPHVEVVATRKVFPGTKELAVKALVAGGALPHRLGLSETVLVFDQHRVFLRADLPGILSAMRRRACEKKVIAEATSIEDALALTRAGIDGIQFDKVPPALLRAHVESLRAIAPGLLILAAGGIDAGNAAAYASTGVDALATSAMYFGKPCDIEAKLEAIH